MQNSTLETRSFDVGDDVHVTFSKNAIRLFRGLIVAGMALPKGNSRSVHR